MSASAWVFLHDCTIIAVTDKAIRVVFGDDSYWLPKSQVEDPERLKEGDVGVTVGITEWIADTKNIEVD